MYRAAHYVSAGVLVLIGLSLGTNSATGATWNRHTVDTTGGEYASLVLVNDVPHIAYVNPVQTRYAWYDVNTQTWRTETIIPHRYTHTSLALVDGIPHMALAGSGGMSLAARNGQGIPGWENWEFTSIDGSVDQYCNLRVDTSGNLHACGYDEDNGRLRYAYREAGETDWINLNVDSLGGSGCGMTLDGTTPHISYRDRTNGTLKYATYQPGMTAPYFWRKETLWDTQDVEGYTSIVVDDDADAHVSFYQRGSDYHVRYATGEFSSWSTDDVSYSDMGWYNSIAVDEDDRPYVAYAIGGMLSLSWPDDEGTWHHEMVDTGDRENGHHVVGPYCSLSLDSLGRPHIAYWDETIDDLVYAYRETAIPEPATAALLVLGGLMLAFRRGKR